MITRIPSLLSTNSYMTARAGDFGHGDAVVCREQTAGRGQRGNTWEAEPGCNLTFSLMLRPEGVEAREQFLVSEAVALGVARVVQRHLPEAEIKVKWPNDIYAGDRKICGILIENVITGRMLAQSVAGIGLNVNQRTFRSDAPNPVSMWQIAGREFDLDQLLDELISEILDLLTRLDSLPALYASMLWRGEGEHLFADLTRGGEQFTARVHTVAPTGTITLSLPDATLRHFVFKEIAWL